MNTVKLIFIFLQAFIFAFFQLTFNLMLQKLKNFYFLIRLEILMIYLYLLILIFMEKSDDKKQMLAEVKDIIFLREVEKSKVDKYFDKN